MARKRDYAKAYQQRVARGLARGLTRQAARGHAPTAAGQSGVKSAKFDPTLEAALKSLRKPGASLTSVAKEVGVGRERLSNYIKAVANARHVGRRWQFNDTRRRRLKIIEAGVDQSPLIRVAGYDPASLAGLHAFEAGEMIADPDTLLDGFQKRWAGQGVTDIHGRWHPFSTDPNQIDRAILNQDYDFEKYYLIEQQEG